MALSINIQDQQQKSLTTTKASLRSRNKKRSPIKLIIFVLTLSLLGISLFFGYGHYKKLQESAQAMGINVNTSSVIDQLHNKEPELKRDSSGKLTNVLLVGKDTRATNGSLQNTDTIIVASYNHETNSLVMISIPRDTFVEAPEGGWYLRINGIYNIAEQKKPGSGLPTLQKKVEEYTGLEIQYYGLVDLEGFKKIIDILGGIDVDVENSFTDYRYPGKYPGQYQVVSFKKGLQHMNGETALKYARSRHSLDNGEGSDFSRAKRQQRVIIAVKNKLLTKDTLLNPQKILDLAKTLQKNIQFSEITAEDINAGIKLFKEKSSTIKSYSFVLSNAVGHPRLLTSHSGLTGNAYGIVPVAGITNYTDIHNYIRHIIQEPEIYEEDPSILVYNIGLGYQEAFALTKNLIRTLPYMNIAYMGTLYSTKTGTYVYNQNKNAPKSLNKIVSILQEQSKQVSTNQPDFIRTRLNGEDITILVGKPESNDTNPSANTQ